MFAELNVKPVCSTMVGWMGVIFKFLMFKLPENKHFNSCPHPKLSSRLLQSPQSEGNYSFTSTPSDNSLLIYSITPETAFFGKSFSPRPAERDIANNYLFKVNNRNTGKRCEICSKLTITLLTLFFCLYWNLWTYFTPFSSTSIVDFEFCLLGREETIWRLS